MKILEISGANLASLKDEFRISLNEPPFAKDGLFAIRGVKGSGKSTLIDAMCLALYDETPRTHGSGGPRVGLPDQEDKDRIASTDPRGLLRRGAAQGWAQVVFLGTDGRQWRAKWSVSRARKKAEGRLQAQAMELEDLQTHETFTGNRSEVLPKIRKMVGLDFDQFRRSVLLAQGEFAAFVLANEDQRASLLEAMTGTSIYARISAATYRRCALEEQKLKELTRDQESLGLLTEDERTEKETSGMTLTEKIVEQDQKLSATLADLGWYAKDAELAGQADAAIESHRVAESEHLAAEDRRRILKRVDEAMPLRPLHGQVQTSAARKKSLAGQIEEDAKRLPQVEADLTQKEISREQAKKVLAGVEGEFESAKPYLIAARDLDTRIAAADTQFQSATLEATRKRQAAINSAAELNAAHKKDQYLVNNLSLSDQLLTENEKFRQLSHVWNQAKPTLEAYAETLIACQKTQINMQETQSALQSARGELTANQSSLEQWIAKTTAQQDRLKNLKIAIAKDPRAALDKSRRLHQGELDRIRKAEALLERLQATLAQLGTVRAEETSQGAIKATAESQEHKLATDLIELDGRLQEARCALEKAQAALSLEDQRHLLIQGEACPLCGSLEHPWAEGTPLAGLFDAQRKQVQSLERKKGLLEKSLVSVRADLGAAEQALKKALKDAKTFENFALQEEKTWAGLRADQDWPLNPREAHALTVIHERGLDIEEKLKTIQAREEALLRLEKEAEALERDLGETEKKRKDLEKVVKQLSEQSQKLEVREATLASDSNNQEKVLKAARIAFKALLEPIPNAADRMDREPKVLLAELEKAVQDYLSLEALHQDLLQQKANLALQLGGLETSALANQRAALEAEQACANLQNAIAALQEARKAFWNGQSVGQVELELNNRLKRAKEAHEQAASAYQVANTALGSLRAVIDTRQNQLQQATEEVQASVETLKIAIEAAGWSFADAIGLIAWTAEQIQSERQALQAIDHDLSQAKAVLKEYMGALVKHRKSGAPTTPLTELKPLALLLKDEVDQHRQTLGGLLEQLRVDDEARQKSADFAALIKAQFTITKLWMDLNELIGSSDGKKFRTFAQSLTLEALVAFANDHLAGLDPRYRLQRVPGYELELQIVDLDMGDEIRALTSLSGGETFLVSLSLALGLSSLSASETPIESLFIDEGFGTLDSGALEVALSMLDELQSQGRQVGIISHVDGLASHIPHQILVEKLGGGISRITLPTAQVRLDSDAVVGGF